MNTLTTHTNTASRLHTKRQKKRERERQTKQNKITSKTTTMKPKKTWILDKLDCISWVKHWKLGFTLFLVIISMLVCMYMYERVWLFESVFSSTMGSGERTRMIGLVWPFRLPTEQSYQPQGWILLTCFSLLFLPSLLSPYLWIHLKGWCTVEHTSHPSTWEAKTRGSQLRPAWVPQCNSASKTSKANKV